MKEYYSLRITVHKVYHSRWAWPFNGFQDKKIAQTSYLNELDQVSAVYEDIQKLLDSLPGVKGFNLGKERKQE